MQFKILARKPRKNLDILGLIALKINLTGLGISSEPVSTIQDQDDLDSLKRLAQILAEIAINSLGQVRPDMCSEGYFVIYEFPFKIGFRWPYSPLSRSFMLTFNFASGQLMPKFWRVVSVIERLTKDGGGSFNVNELLMVYIVKADVFHHYSLYSNYRRDRTLVLNTVVNDRGWKSRYTFVRMAILGLDSDWLEPDWKKSNQSIFFDDVKPISDSVYKITRFLGYSAADRSYSPLPSTGDDNEITILEPLEVEVEEVEEERVEEREEEREVEMAGSGLPKRPRMMIPREPSSRGGGSSSIASPEKAKMDDPIPAVPIKFVPPVTESPKEPNVERTTSEEVQETGASGSNPPSSDKGKEPADVQMVNSTCPSDFMADDVLDRARIFPYLSKYLLLWFKDKFKMMRIDDVGSHFSGLSFMMFQGSLGLYRDIERLRQAMSRALDREKAALDREKVALSREKEVRYEVESLATKLEEANKVAEVANGQVADLQSHLRVSYEILEGTQEELDRARVFLVMNEKETRDAKERKAKQKFRIEELEEELKADDLNSEDEKDMDEVEVDTEEAKTDETLAGDASVSMPTEDAPPS
ncbi:hypothetical protein L6452_02673 [Arctium lappa]|uniref:Uncharacterized protein n=1 Tax=Arctium lappa TaxID=4217 RepID=A0ACB9FKQ1_ARCLA|nr:hypothetical protein L6452_02673 [Arctium lappa]